MAIRFGAAIAAPAPASSFTAWNDSDQPLPDILSAPTLRSVSSLVMSMDAEESVFPAASAAYVSGGLHSSINNNNRIPRTSRTTSSKDHALSGATTSTMLDPFLAPLPPPSTAMDSNDLLTREQSFPPASFFPQQPRFARDQSFPPPVQQSGGLAAINMLPSTSSCLPSGGWPNIAQPLATRETLNGGGGGMMEDGDIFGAGGGESSMPKFRGLGFPVNNSRQAPLQTKGWGPEHGGGRGHLGGGNGGCSSLVDEEYHHPVFDGMLSSSPSSTCHARRPSFDKLAAMIPDIPHWPTPSSSTSAPLSPSPRVPVDAGELPVHVSTRAESAEHLPAPMSTARSNLPPPSSPASAQPVPSPSRGRQPTTIPRSEKKIEKEPLRRGGAAISAGRLPRGGSGNHGSSRWKATPSPAVTNASGGGTVKKTASSGTGKRGTEAPLSCGPARAGGGPVDLAKQERRRVKIQRYLYKRSRRKFAKSTRDASPSRSRPKAAAKRPRVKGKFVKSIPDYVSVNSGQQEGEGLGETEAISKKVTTSSSSPVGAFPVAGGGRGGGGVRSVRDGGSVNINFNNKAFSTTLASTLMPKGGGAGGGRGRLPPPMSALETGAPNAFSWSM
ncbi:unnamed protein product [Pylaiella littoralis]